MPGLYNPPDYDLAGFIVGYVEEDRVLGSHRVQPDDVLIGLPSSGLHTNGYSLARKIVTDRLKLRMADQFPGDNQTVADVLLTEHKSYLPAMKPVLDRIHAMAHITGGGLLENLDRALPPTLDAVIDATSWRVPRVFGVLMEAGKVDRSEMYRTFNMGVGMVVICAPSDVTSVLSAAEQAGLKGWRIGSLRPGSGSVILS
jgi:phosphoribosylformylglycinamidine cyclo-ligase